MDIISAFVGFLIGGTSFGLNTLVFITLLLCKELRQNTHYNLFISGITLSFFQTFLISFHRFLKISETSFDQILLKNNRKYATYICIWLAVFGFNLSMIEFRHYNAKLPFCEFTRVFGEWYPIIVTYFQIITILLMSLTITFYLLTLRQIRMRYRKNFIWQANQNCTSSTANQNEATVKSNPANEQMATHMRRKIFGSLK